MNLHVKYVFVYIGSPTFTSVTFQSKAFIAATSVIAYFVQTLVSVWFATVIRF